MSITVQLPDQMAEWLKSTVEQTGLPAEEVILKQLSASINQPPASPNYMRLAGVVKGLPSDLSQRKGFDRG